MKGIIIAIGDELLNGQTIDSNAAWLGIKLNEIGVDIIEKITVPDKESTIHEALERSYSRADLILTTGGLGPTKDDITKKVIADFIGDDLVFNQIMYERILRYFKRLGHKTTEAHKNQCYLPSSTEILTNSRGSAPGMWVKKDKTILIALPGVPYEMEGIMEEFGLQKIREYYRNSYYIQHFVIQTAGCGETRLAEKIADLAENLPKGLSLAYLPGIASVKLRVSGKGKDKMKIQKEVQQTGHSLLQRLGKIVFGVGNISLGAALGELCLQKRIKIGTAESCTGGKIAHMIVSVPGSSHYFEGCVVSYSNGVKTDLLKVKTTTLRKHGAVSEKTVIEMVDGTLKALRVDVALAVSGIAGPSGGTVEKPVGTIWVAVGNKEKTVTQKLQLAKSRNLNIDYASIFALNLMRLFIQDKI